MTPAVARENNPIRSGGITAVAALLLTVAGCSTGSRDDGPEPFVLPEGAAAPAAPFRGPSRQIAEEPSRVPDEAQAAAVPEEPNAPPSPPVAEIAIPTTITASSAADHRREVWLSESFRCKAISTTRLRRCRFEHTGGGYRLTFPVADVTCDGVTFDNRGDPARLTGCRGAWLRVPSTNRLRPDRTREVWSGSHSGWRWKGDRQPYCCPGLWLEAPASLRR